MENRKDERGENSTKNGQKKGEKSVKKKVEQTTEKKVSTAKKMNTATKAGAQVAKKASTAKNTNTATKARAQVAKKASTAKNVSTAKNMQAKIENSEEPKMERRKGNTCLHFIWNIFVKILTLVIIFISIIIVIQKVTNNEESFFGFRIFRVQTGSMIPKYQIGDVILVKETEPDKIKIGDDVTYEGETGSMKGMLVTHRVIDIEEVDGKRVFHTQGIANNLEDPVVNEDQVNGVVQTKMYILSLICMLLNNKYVFYFCGILPLTIYVAFRIFKGKRVKRIEREN